MSIVVVFDAAPVCGGLRGLRRRGRIGMISRMSNQEDNLPTSAATVIVGGGFSGLALADEMTRRGAKDVLVIEAGPDSGREHYRQEFDDSTAISMWLDPFSDRHSWRPYETSGLAFSGVSAIRRRLGGRSLYWHGMVLPIEPWALSSDWPAAVVRDLTVGWEDGQPLYARATERLADWTCGSPHRSLSSGRTVDLAGYRFTEAPRAIRRSAQDGRWRAYSPFERWHGEAKMLCDARVDDIATDAGRVRGVRIEHGGRRHFIAAPVVVLAASTVENSRLAIQSLAAHGRLSGARLTGLVDKVAQGFVATFDRDHLPSDLLDAANHHRGYVCPSPGLRSNAFLNVSVNPSGVAVVDAYLMGEQTRGAHGSVWCDASPVTPWRTQVECRLGAEDVRLVESQRAELQRMYAAIRALTGGRPAPDALSFTDAGEFGSADLPQRLLRARSFESPQEPYTYAFPLGSEQHEAGTLPLGAILDDNFQFHDVPGLYACGPSAFPRTGAANPALTIVALAMRLAATLSPSVRSREQFAADV